MSGYGSGIHGKMRWDSKMEMGFPNREPYYEKNIWWVTYIMNGSYLKMYLSYIQDT